MKRRSRTIIVALILALLSAEFLTNKLPSPPTSDHAVVTATFDGGLGSLRRLVRAIQRVIRFLIDEHCDPDGNTDAGDAGTDAGDAGTDAGDAGTDAGGDAGGDAGCDPNSDAGCDPGGDAGSGDAGGGDAGGTDTGNTDAGNTDAGSGSGRRSNRGSRR